MINFGTHDIVLEGKGRTRLKFCYNSDHASKKLSSFFSVPFHPRPTTQAPKIQALLSSEPIAVRPAPLESLSSVVLSP